MKWLLNFIMQTYAELPEDLNVSLITPRETVNIHRLESEADEFWSFVGKKSTEQPPTKVGGFARVAED